MKKNCLISGATSGIGKAAALELARRGYDLILLGRNQERCQTVRDLVLQEDKDTKVDYHVADLSSRAQVKELGQQLRASYDHIDVLVNNAGAVFMKEERSVDGIEMTWALNHFGYFWLTNEVLELVKKSSNGARIINVSSAAHLRAVLKSVDNIFEQGGMLGYFTYGNSKLANLWFTFELARKLQDSGITVNALHPGIVSTRFAANNGLMGLPFKVLTSLFGLSSEDGAKTIVYLADSKEVDDITGAYFIKERKVGSSKLSNNKQLAKDFWLASEQKTKEVDATLRQGLDR